MKQIRMPRTFALIVLLTGVLGTGARASDFYQTLRPVIAGPSELFLFNTVSSKCWKLTPGIASDSAIEFNVAGHDNLLRLDTATGAAKIPHRWVIKKRILSSAERVVNRCKPKEEIRTYSAGDSLQTKPGAPYLWMFKTTVPSCRLVGVYTDCRTDCRGRIPVGTEVAGIAKSRYVAEKMAEATCEP